MKELCCELKGNFVGVKLDSKQQHLLAAITARIQQMWALMITQLTFSFLEMLKKKPKNFFFGPLNK